MRLSSKGGMQTLDQALVDLVKSRIVTQEEAMMKSSNPERLQKSLQFGYELSRL